MAKTPSLSIITDHVIKNDIFRDRQAYSLCSVRALENQLSIFNGNSCTPKEKKYLLF